MKAESQDHIAGDCCDPLLEVGQRMAVASRGARCKCRSRTLDVTPSRPATSSSPDKRRMTAARIRAQFQQCRAQPVKCKLLLSAILSQAIADSDGSSAASANPFAVLLVARWRGSRRSIGCGPPLMTLPTAIKASFNRRGSVSPCREGLLPLLDWLWSSAAASPPAPATNNFPRRSRLLAPVR
jgi:hypothetical protein